MRGKFSFLLATFVIVALALAARGPARAQTSTWQNVTGNLANMASECGNMSLLSAMPGSPTVIAGVAMRGLWANTAGTTWTQMGSGAGSATIINRPNWIVYDPLNSSTLLGGGALQQRWRLQDDQRGLDVHPPRHHHSQRLRQRRLHRRQPSNTAGGRARTIADHLQIDQRRRVLDQHRVELSREHQVHQLPPHHQRADRTSSTPRAMAAAPQVSIAPRTAERRGTWSTAMGHRARHS